MIKHLNTKELTNKENGFADTAIGIAPWLTPVPAAALTMISTHKYIFYELPVIGWGLAIITGLVVELLGFAIINTYFLQSNHNRKHASTKHLTNPSQAVITKAKNKHLNQSGIITAFVIYLVDITVINVLLDLAAVVLGTQGQAIALIVAKGLLIYLSIPAGIVIAARQTLYAMQQTLQAPRKVSKTLEPKPKTLPPATKTLQQQLAQIKSLRTLRKKPELLKFVNDTPTAMLIDITGKEAATIAEWKAAAKQA